MFNAILEAKPILNALRRSKAGAILLMLQIAITTAIVSNAAFIIYDRAQYLQQDTGYAEDEVFYFSVTTFGSDVDLSKQFEETETLLRAIPGVIDAVIMADLPLSGSGSGNTYNLLPYAQQNSEGDRSEWTSYTRGDEHVLNTLGLEISEGRNFLPSEVGTGDIAATVAIVSRAFADAMFPEGDALGQTIYDNNDAIKIVGIVDKMMGPWLRSERADNYVIFPVVRASVFQHVAVRTAASERASIMKSVDDVLLGQYDKRVIINHRGMDEAKENYNAADLLMLRMLVVLIVVLVLITALGIFGMTVFNINKRTRQIGTRRALGARKSAIVQYFLVENGLICLAGLVIGCIGAYYLGGLLLSEYSLPALDNLYIVVTAVAVLAVSLLSVLLPANRAANISPSIATRTI